jgi:hypothetical protein
MRLRRSAKSCGQRSVTHSTKRDERRDALLRQLLKTPPLSREQFRKELKTAREAAKQAKKKATG